MTLRPPYPARRQPAPGPGAPDPRRPILTGSFTDRVMARVAEEPTPSPGRVFARSLGHLALRDALAALVTAWRLAFEPSGQVRARTRASAAALFLGVIVLVGLGGSVLTGSALFLFGPEGSTPQQLVPGASPTDAIELTPAPSATPKPEAADASHSPQPRSDEATKPKKADQKAGKQRVTPEPKERERDEKKEKKRETPEPRERERDEKDDDDDYDDD